VAADPSNQTANAADPSNQTANAADPSNQTANAADPSNQTAKVYKPANRAADKPPNQTAKTDDSPNQAVSQVSARAISALEKLLPLSQETTPRSRGKLRLTRDSFVTMLSTTIQSAFCRAPFRVMTKNDKISDSMFMFQCNTVPNLDLEEYMQRFVSFACLFICSS
jgi:hypothetical protein